MKKKLMCLALGVVAACSVYSQINFVGVIDATTVTGQVTNVNAGSGVGPTPFNVLQVGTQITVQNLTPGPNFGAFLYFMVVPATATNPPGLIGDVANLVGNVFNNNFVQGANVGGSGQASFGSNTGNFALQAVPFDFGISAVLGAGAIAAVKTARRRRKEQEVATA